MALPKNFTAKQVQRLRNNFDGTRRWVRVSHGLYVDRLKDTWVFRYKRNGQQNVMGLGPMRNKTLADARQEIREYHVQLDKGLDPAEERRSMRLANLGSISFKEARTRYFDARSGEWRNEKHRAQWENSLQTYADPVLGKMSVDKIETHHVLRVLEPIWQSKTETATRVRQRIENVLNWATILKYRTGANPAQWKGHLDAILPKPSKLKTVDHHAALPYEDTHAFLIDLRKQEGVAARALEFLILTAARTGEILEASWDEIDLNQAIWTVPASRMKANREHRVPLSNRTIEILQELDQLSDEWVFPSPTKADKPLSNMAMAGVIKRMGRTGFTVHGFRSSFRDWAAEQTNFPREVAEQALAHSLDSKVEAAYRRSDLFSKRLQLMNAWANFCEALPGKGNVYKLGVQS